MKKFNYVVAHTWDSNPGALSCYTYFTQVNYGTKKDAKGFLAYVKKQIPDKDWKIYKISLKNTL